MKLKDIIETFGEAMEMKYKDKILPGHRKAMSAIQRCRTEESGTIHVKCPECGDVEIFNHSCGNRNCPVCQHHETSRWIDRQMEKLLPVDYFMVTVTVPYELRQTVWYNQKICYNGLFDSASKAMNEISENPKHLGGDIGITAVLHTHARNLDYHPHVHFIIPGGAIDKKNKLWKKKKGKYLFPWKKLSKLFKGKLLAMLKEHGISFPESVYRKEWRVNMENVGSGREALLYLSRYLYRGVISEKRITDNHDGTLTFSYIESKTKKVKYKTMKGEDFLFQVIQHVLPKGFRRCRDYGFLHGNAKKTLKLLQLMLHVKLQEASGTERPDFKCPKCGSCMSIMYHTFLEKVKSVKFKRITLKIPA
jgi:hypothetical protein